MVSLRSSFSSSHFKSINTIVNPSALHICTASTGHTYKYYVNNVSGDTLLYTQANATKTFARERMAGAEGALSLVFHRHIAAWSLTPPPPARALLFRRYYCCSSPCFGPSGALWKTFSIGTIPLIRIYVPHVCIPFLSTQARLGVDVEGVFRRHDPEQSGAVLRSDFVQAVMELGVGLLDSSTSR